jgi:hypothetical protein
MSASPDNSPDVCIHGYCATTHTIAWIVAGACCIGSIYISLQLIEQHLTNFACPREQRKIVGILWIVPIFAVDSWLSLKFIDVSMYLDMFRDCYESYVIYLFLALMMTYLSGGAEDAFVQRLESNPLPRGRYVFPFSCVWTTFEVDRAFLRMCKRGAMQFCLIKPLCTFIAMILEAEGLYGEGEWRPDRGYMWITIILNFSISWAAYCLLLFYIAFHDMLSPYRPVPKFLSIKAVLFLSFWQSVAFSALNYFDFIHQIGSYTANDVQTALQDFCVCVEMLIMAVAHRYAFSADPYRGMIVQGGGGPGGSRGRGRVATAERSLLEGDGTGGWRGSATHRLLSDNFAVDDAVRDFNDSMPVALPSAFEPGRGRNKPRSVRRAPLPPATDIFGGGGPSRGAGTNRARATETTEGTPREAEPQTGGGESEEGAGTEGRRRCQAYV